MSEVKKPKRRPSTGMTIGEAAEKYGLSKSALQRRIAALEKSRREQVFTRRGCGEKRQHVVLTDAVLREHFPDLFPRRDKRGEYVLQELERYQERLGDLTTRVEQIESLLREIARMPAKQPSERNGL